MTPQEKRQVFEILLDLTTAVTGLAKRGPEGHRQAVNALQDACNKLQRMFSDLQNPPGVNRG